MVKQFQSLLVKIGLKQFLLTWSEKRFPHLIYKFAICTFLFPLIKYSVNPLFSRFSFKPSFRRHSFLSASTCKQSLLDFTMAQYSLQRHLKHNILWLKSFTFHLFISFSKIIQKFKKYIYIHTHTQTHPYMHMHTYVCIQHMHMRMYIYT